MRGFKNRIEKLEARHDPDDFPWSMERKNGVLTAPNGQTMTDRNYLKRRNAGRPIPLLWADEEPTSEKGLLPEQDK